MTEEHGMRTALAAIMEAMRAGYGPHNLRPRDLPDAGHDPQFVEKVRPLLEFLWTRYFRVELRGLEHIPANGPAIVVGNHSGGLPWDGLMLIYGIYRDHPQHRRLRTLVANFAFHSAWMSNVVARIGGVQASRENALPLLEQGDLVGVFPEGLKGVGKLFRERYRLSRFGRGGFARLARAAGVPLIPTAIVGAEEVHPILAKVTRIAEPLGLPYIPITPTFPLLGPLGLLPVPTKWYIDVGAPIEPASDEADDMVVAETVRSQVDAMIAARLARRRSILFG